MQLNAKVLSTSCRKTCHCRVLVRENSHKGQNGKATVFVCLCDAIFLVSFLPCRTPSPDHVHESLPDHFRPCPQNTWAPYYTAARDWLKPKGVSALTDGSGVVYWTQRLYRHCKRVCTGSWLWEKNHLPQWGLKRALALRLDLVLHLDFQLDALPTDLFLPPEGDR